MDNRGVSPSIGKLLAAGIVVLYLAGSVTVLGGSVVPETRTAAAQELAERVLGDAVVRLERALQPGPGQLDGRIRLPTPATIGGDGYRLVLHNETLSIQHPDPRLSIEAGLAVPAGVRTAASAVDSGASVLITVEGAAGNRTVGVVEAA